MEEAVTLQDHPGSSGASPSRWELNTRGRADPAIGAGRIPSSARVWGPATSPGAGRVTGNHPETSPPLAGGGEGVVCKPADI